VYRGADDNAAAVAILVEVARALTARRPDGRGVIFAAFDAEEPPHFQTDTMGSEHYARHPTVPLDAIDMMVCMDLVGHAVGPEGLPSAVRGSVFALGAERSEGTAEIVRATHADGVHVRPVDAEVIPPLSDYYAFWTRRRPFLLLTNARSRVYHTPEDVPAALAWDKMAATARWLEAFVRASCARDERPVTFTERGDDLSTIESLAALLEPLAETRREAEMALEMLRALRASLRADATLPPDRRAELAMLVAGIETALA
jgi:Zn-dependent M28 family amino/carboxypeptidase